MIGRRTHFVQIKLYSIYGNGHKTAAKPQSSDEAVERKNKRIGIALRAKQQALRT